MLLLVQSPLVGYRYELFAENSADHEPLSTITIPIMDHSPPLLV